MIALCLNNKQFGEVVSTNYEEIVDAVVRATHLNPDEFYLEQQGKRISSTASATANGAVHCVLRLCGGKGGFGSMLRAIGAQIEKTTNREACRDLSGRRLRDINEEKRLKAWLDKQGEREREAEERKKRKLEKLLAVPKHEFKDAKYEEARSKLTEKVSDAVEEGFKQAAVAAEKEAQKASGSGSSSDGDAAGSSAATVNKLKRKSGAKAKAAAKKKKAQKGALWIGDDISSTDSSDDDSDADATAAVEKNKATIEKKQDSEEEKNCVKLAKEE